MTKFEWRALNDGTVRRDTGVWRFQPVMVAVNLPESRDSGL
jgi:hypothetical protein